MNKFGSLLLIAAFCSVSSVFAETCKSDDLVDAFKGNEKFLDMGAACVAATEKQIKKEITASMKYLSMGAHFSKDSVNRPGFAKFFFDAASEEREHAHMLIEYLSMRGRYLNKVEGEGIRKIDIIKLVQDVDKDSAIQALFEDPEFTLKPLDQGGLAALQNALKLETAVTKSIRDLIKTCESKDTDDKNEPFNHFHFVDYLTGEFLEEQYKGQRDLAGKISTLAKMVKAEGSVLADFLFDKQLL